MTGRLRPQTIRPGGSELRRQYCSAWSLERKGQRTRAIRVPVPSDSGSIGLTLQWTPLAVVSNIWHVLDVPANSPADTAGLLPYSDYILGSPEGVLHGESGLGELVEDHIGRPLRLYVYNNEYNVTREVTIQPSREWGGEGALGCVLGYGALHRLPAPLSEPVSAPGRPCSMGIPSPRRKRNSCPQGLLRKASYLQHHLRHRRRRRRRQRTSSSQLRCSAHRPRRLPHEARRRIDTGTAEAT